MFSIPLSEAKENRIEINSTITIAYLAAIVLPWTQGWYAQGSKFATTPQGP